MASTGKHLTMLRNDLAITQNSHLCEQSKWKIYHSRLICQAIIVCYYRRAVRVRGNIRGSRVTHPGTPFLKGAVEENLVMAQLSGKCKRQPMDSQLKPCLQSLIQEHQAAICRWQVSQWKDSVIYQQQDPDFQQSISAPSLHFINEERQWVIVLTVNRLSRTLNPSSSGGWNLSCLASVKV